MADARGLHGRAVDELVAAVAAEPTATLVALDFDGSLAPIVEVPSAAVLAPGADVVLARLARDVGRVLVVSGRPVAFLVEHLPDAVDVTGLYGLEGVESGSHWERDDAVAWRRVVADTVAAALAELPAGVRVEDKALSITLHVREHPEHEAVALEWAEAAAETSGLVVRAARRSFELHPPIDVDKGAVVHAAAHDRRLVVFAGDDLGDLSAFDALDRLATEGRRCWRIAVASAESPDELLARADIVLDGPRQLVELLDQLGGATPTAAS